MSTYTMEHLARMTMGEVDDKYRVGLVTQDQFEAYMHVWATSSFHHNYASRGWLAEPTCPTVRALADDLRSMVGR